MIHYGINELSSSETVTIQKDDYLYVDLNRYYHELTITLSSSKKIVKFNLKCSAQVQLINMQLISNQNELKHVNIPEPQKIIKLGFAELHHYKIDINDGQYYTQINLKLKDQTEKMRIYHIGILREEQQRTNFVQTQQGDIRNFFNAVTTGNSYQRGGTVPQRQDEPYQTDYTNQQFGLRANFQRHKSQNDESNDIMNMSFDEQRQQRIALERFQAEKKKQENKQQGGQQNQRYEQKILLADKIDGKNNHKITQEKNNSQQNRINYVKHIKQQQGDDSNSYQLVIEDNKEQQFQAQLGYNDPNKYQYKRNHSKDSNKSYHSNKSYNSQECDENENIDILDSRNMDCYRLEDYSPIYQQLIQSTGREQEVRMMLAEQQAQHLKRIYQIQQQSRENFRLKQKR